MPVTAAQVPLRTAKSWAKRFCQALSATEYPAPLSLCQTALAHALGFSDWHELSQRLKEPTAAPALMPMGGHTDLPNLHALLLQTTLPDESELAHIWHEWATLFYRDEITRVHFEELPGNHPVVRIRVRHRQGHLQEWGRVQQTTLIALLNWLYQAARTPAPDWTDPDPLYSKGYAWFHGIALSFQLQSLPVSTKGRDLVLDLTSLQSRTGVFWNALGLSEDQQAALLSSASGLTVLAGSSGSGKTCLLLSLLEQLPLSLQHQAVLLQAVDEYPNRRPVAHTVFIPRPANLQAKDCMFMYQLAQQGYWVQDEVQDATGWQMLWGARSHVQRSFTTVNAASALDVVERMTDFGGARAQLLGDRGLSVLVYQKLMPKLCPHCRVILHRHLGDHPEDQRIQQLGERWQQVRAHYPNTPDLAYVRGPGCLHCQQGVTGRQLVMEYIELDEPLRALLRSDRTVDAWNKWRATSDGQLISTHMRGKVAQEHALHLAVQGGLGLDDIENMMGLIHHPVLLQRMLQ